jgi:CAAX protease family protein
VKPATSGARLWAPGPCGRLPLVRSLPKPLTGILVFLGYLVVFYGVWIINGVEYDNISESADTIVRWIVAPLAAGAVYLVIVVSALGWWRPAMFEVEKATPRWLLVGPILMLLFAIVGLSTSDKSGVTMAMFWLALLGSLLVGFCEELATRGALIVGLRGRLTEPRVWFISTLLFGLMHLPNWVFGAGPAASLQVFLAFGGGSILYLTRRLTGSLVYAMLLHAIWDFASFLGEPAALVTAFPFLVLVVGLVLVFILLRREKGVHTPQVGVPETVAVPAV